MNETDPLAQLKDIHLPSAIDGWPPAFGWWLLALLLVGALVLIGVSLVRWHRRRAWRREALTAIPRPDGRSVRDTAYYSELNQLLKRAARVRYHDAGSDRMSGEPWQQFLARQAPQLPAAELAALARAPFQKEAEISPDAAFKLARNWLRSQSC